MKNKEEKSDIKSNISNSQSQLYSLKKEDMILLIMDFLKNEGYDRSYISLEQESGINLYNYDENLGILRGFILDGDWEEAEKSLEIFKNKINFPYKNLIFEIRKEKLIEEVEAQQKDGTFDGLAKELKDLQDLGCNKEFNNLMDYLKETEHDVLNETISRRLEIFNKIRNQITFQYPISKSEIIIKPNKLKEIFSKLIEKFVNLTKTKNNNNIYTINDIENFLKLKFEQDALFNILDSDTKKNTIIHHSPNNNNNKDSSKFSENESNLLNINKFKKGTKTKSYKSSIERLAETYDDLELWPQCKEFEAKPKKIQKSKSFSKANDNNNKNKKSDKSSVSNSSRKKTIKINKKVTSNSIWKKKVKDINSKKSNKKNVIICNKKKDVQKVGVKNFDKKNGNKNLKTYSFKDTELSDLDQDEYFLKNCYDYYNYDISSLELKKVIEDSNPIRCCCFSPKGEYFAIGTNSKCVKIYDLSNVLEKINKKNSVYTQLKNNNAQSILSKESIGMIFEQKEHHFGSIFCIDWSSSGKLIATGSNDKIIKLLNIPDLESQNNNTKILKEHKTYELQITGNQGTVRSLCFEPGNDLILLSANNCENTVKIWDTIKGINIICLEGHNSDVISVKWSNDSQLFASCGNDKTVRFWDIREHKNINILSGIQYDGINDISIYSSSNNSTIALGHKDGLITIWDYSKRCVIKEIYEHNEEVRSVAFSPDGKYLLSGSFDSKIKIYDINNNYTPIGELEHGDKVVSCKWHPEVPLIISTSADKTARVWIPSIY